MSSSWNKKNLKHFTPYVLTVLLFGLVVAPAFATAQNRNRSRGRSANAATTTAAVLMQEGPVEPSAVRIQQVSTYRRQSSEQQQKIAALGPTATASVFMPVLFGIEPGDISPNFGAPRSGGRTHEGEDIIADKGTPIISPTPAVVLRTGVGATEGNYVYTANPGGETFVYMHLDRIGEGVVSGAVLNQGSLIGYVGDTGNALGGPAHLHFEIHSSGGTPMDPFPRLTGYLSLQQKISYLSTILTQTSDSGALSQFLVIYFRDTFTAALASNIVLPQIIMNYLASTPASTVPPNSAGGLPAGDLDLGSSGSLVITLQTYLIQAASGPAATRLAGAGATGNFGPLTQAALIEFQTKVGISPASGYYGVSTRTYIAQHLQGGGAVSIPPSTIPVATNPPLITGPASIPSRDLDIGARGADVVWLQSYLISVHAGSASVALSAAGATGYFGPITQRALAEYQALVHISPAVGYFGPITRTYFQGIIH